MWGKRKRKRRSTATPGIILIRQILIGVFVILVLALCCVLVWYGSRIRGLTIDSVTVSGGETVSYDEVRMVAEQQLEGSYVALVPRRFAWFYPEERIEAAVRGVARIKDARVERRGTEVTIDFEEYQPAFLWCGSTECLFVDGDGYAFEHAPALTGNAFLRYADPAREPAIGEHAFDIEKAARLRGMHDALAARRGFLVVSAEQSAPDEMMLYLSNGGALKITERMPAEELLANLETVLASEAFAHLADGNFEYIDLRYGDRVFVNEFGDETIDEEVDEENE